MDEEKAKQKITQAYQKEVIRTLLGEQGKHWRYYRFNKLFRYVNPNQGREMNIYRVFFEDKKKGRKIDLNYACDDCLQILEALNPAAKADFLGFIKIKDDVTEAEIKNMKSPVMVIPQSVITGNVFFSASSKPGSITKAISRMKPLNVEPTPIKEEVMYRCAGVEKCTGYCEVNRVPHKRNSACNFTCHGFKCEPVEQLWACQTKNCPLNYGDCSKREPHEHAPHCDFNCRSQEDAHCTPWEEKNDRQ